MSATKTPAVLGREISKTTASTTGQIDPFAIYGFADSLREAIENKSEFKLSSHPDFPNPRKKFEKPSLDIIQNVVTTKTVREPLVLKNIGSKTEPIFILLDGKTRLTGVANYMIENPEDATAFQTVPYILFTGSDAEARVFMGATNYERANLTSVMWAEHIAFLHDVQKVSLDELQLQFNREGSAGLRYIKEMLKLGGSKTLTEAVKKGEVNTTTAKAIAQKTSDPKEQKDKVSKVVKEKTKLEKKGAPKNSEKTERQAAQAAGVRRTNIVVMNGKELATVALAMYADVKQVFKFIEEGKFDESKLDWNNEKARDEYLEAYTLKVQWELLVKVMKINFENARDQFEAFESSLTPQQKKAIPDNIRDWLPAK